MSRSNTVRQNKYSRHIRRCITVLTFIASVPFLVACAGSSNAPKSLSFNAASEKAIVVVGGNIFWTDDFRDPDKSLLLHWQEFDPRALRLVPGGKGFTGLTRASVRRKRADPYPPAQVLQVEPGSYALVAAGSGSFKSVFVSVKERYTSKWGSTVVKDRYLDPQKYIEPQARLTYGRNYLFSVEAGQIIYLGHFEFVRSSRYLGRFTSVRRYEDEAAARAALADYPEISGTMIVVDPEKPAQSATR